MKKIEIAWDCVCAKVLRMIITNGASNLDLIYPHHLLVVSERTRTISASLSASEATSFA